MREFRLRWWRAVGLLAALGLGDAATAEEPVPASASVAGARMRVAIDPETGEFTSEPAPVDADGATTNSLGPQLDEAADLVEEKNPAGGYTVNLRRRFGGVARAAVAPAGVEVECHADENGHPHAAPAALRADAGAPVED